jgi:leucyl-tRNA synthetase
MHETYNFLFKLLEKEISKNSLKENYRKILTIFSPILPHIIFECLEKLNYEVFQKWPEIDKKMISEETIEFVIQKNGKKKATLSTPKDIDEKTLMDQIEKDVNINKVFIDKEITKIFFIKNRLINILIK